MRIVTSDVALQVVLALRQTGHASLATLARALQVSPSSVQRALEILLADDLVATEGNGRSRRYTLVETAPALEAVEQLAYAGVAARDALTLTARANPAIELLGFATNQAIVVFARRCFATDRSRAVEAITKLALMLNLDVEFLDHDDLRREREHARGLRQSLMRGEILVGDLHRSIPDRSGHRKTAGQPLSRINPALRLPARRTLQAIKRRHRVHVLRVFGSAVRDDFRPDSDVDIAVTFDPSAPPDTANLNDLAAELEKRFDHDVDLTLESDLRPAVRYLVERESVAL